MTCEHEDALRAKGWVGDDRGGWRHDDAPSFLIQRKNSRPEHWRWEARFIGGGQYAVTSDPFESLSRLMEGLRAAKRRIDAAVSELGEVNS